MSQKKVTPSCLVDDKTYYDLVDDNGYYHGDIRIFVARNFPEPVIDLRPFLEDDESADDAEEEEDEAGAEVIIDNVQANRLKIEDEARSRFRMAFLAAMKSILARHKTTSYESTSSLCYRLNYEYNLDGKHTLRESVLEEAAKSRLAFASSTLKSPR